MDFAERLKNKRPILCDGAMGTMIYSKGVYINQCYDALNITRPALIEEIHQEFIAAGCEVIETNSFGANSFKLKKHNLEQKVQEINYKAAKVAAKAAGDKVFILGSVGPLGIRIEPWGPTSKQEARAAFQKQIEALVDGGVHGIILETFTDLAEIEQGLLAVRATAPQLPVVTSMTVGIDGTSLYGTTAETFTTMLDRWHADVIGINCSEGPKVMLDTAQRMLPCTDRPISVMPNAGRPRNVNNRNIYMCSPEYMAEYTKRLITSGVRMVGGCCGTTPAHLQAMAQAVRALAGSVERAPMVHITDQDRQKSRKQYDTVPLAQKSALGEKLANQEFVISLEVVPPRGTACRRMISLVSELKQLDCIDAVNIPDGPRASARMSALAVSLLLQQETGIETIMHYTCRDRNILGMQSDLLGAHICGIRNLLLVTGDPPKMGTYPDATAVFDIDAIGLTNLVDNLNQGFDLGRNLIGKPTSFVIGVGVNPGAINLPFELKRFYWKKDAGAEYAITQPAYDVELILSFLEKLDKKNLKIPLIIGIWPLISLAAADFMRNEVPGAWVPEPIYQRMAQAKNEAHAREIGREVALETIAKLKPYIQGIQLSVTRDKLKVTERMARQIRAM